MGLTIFLVLLGVFFLVAELVFLPGVTLGAILAVASYGAAIYFAFARLGVVGGVLTVVAVVAVSLIAVVVGVVVVKLFSMDVNTIGDLYTISGAPPKLSIPDVDFAMIKKSEKLVITFYTTTAAMATEKICKECGADGRIIPVPGSISADCGLAWCAKNESEDALLNLMVQHNIMPQGIYHCLV